METTMRLDLAEKNYSNAGYLVFGSLLLLWLFMPGFIRHFDPTAGGVDPAIWLLILLALIAFLMVAALCWWLLNRFWVFLGLPQLSVMVLQFKTLELWQQLSFYWLSFALLLLVSTLCLAAIC
ncbi:hypothetical protein AAKU52_000678 [Pedobacter sp. CG_S7]|uniref:hypothetical protein n=1 Tax=Pedobacter sp. CG_S7 TaxID=3143930 RepID=UPI003395EC75